MLWKWWRRRQRRRRERQKWRFWRQRKRAAIAFHDSLDLDPPATSSALLQKSLAKLQAAASHSRFSFSLQFRIAEALRILDRHGDAIAVLEKVERRCQQVGDSHLGALACIQMGLALDDKGNYEESTRILLRGVTLAQKGSLPPHVDQLCWLQQVRHARYVLGKQLFYAKDFENALVHLHDLDSPVDAHYFSAAAQFSVAVKLSSNRKQGFEKALNHCQKYLELSCDSDACCLMGRIYVMLEDYEQGAQMIAKAACLAQEEENFVFESYCWWRSGCVLTVSLQRHEEAIVNFNFSIDAALRAKHALYLYRASMWLKQTLSLIQRISTDNWWNFTDLDNIPSQTEVPSQLETLGMCTLGEARLLSGKFNEARQHFQNAFGLIEQERSLELSLLLRLHWGLAEVSSQLCEHEEALQQYKKCKLLAQAEKTKYECDASTARALKGLCKFNEACEVWNRALEEYSTLLDREWELKAELLFGFGNTLLSMGNYDEAISRLGAARTILEEKQLFDSKITGWTYLCLFYAYMDGYQIWHGFQLAKSYEAVMRASIEERHHHQQIWQYMLGTASIIVADNEQATEDLAKIMESELNSKLNSGWIWKCGILSSLANAYRNLGDFDSALDKYAEAINLVPENDKTPRSNVYINRASLYIQMANRQTVEGQATMDVTYWKAYDEYERAINICPYTASLAIAYAGQAAILSKWPDKLEAALEKLEKARNCAGNNRIMIARLKHIRALIYATEGAVAKAQSENREAAIHFATLQMELQELDSAWITLLGGEMKTVFFTMQELCDDRLQALLWAERGRMRLYFRSMGQSESAGFQSKLDPLWFDKDDRLAKECIHQAISSCGLETVFVEYTYSEAEGCLYIYLLQEQEFELSVHFHEVNLIDFFAIKSNSVGGKTLSSLIMRTRSNILKRADDKAKQGLSILYRILVEPVWEYIAGCSSVIFAPHESLFLLPFAALYNDRQKAFLIEQKAVGIIPSIRTLNQCLVKQSEFENRMRMHKMAPAFVAGDPQPMGLGLKQLKGAAEEARIVARILGVRPMIGPEMTKQAVLDGLSKACVSVLVTHGTLNSTFPHGALVMQGQGRHGFTDQAHPATLDMSLRNLVLRGLPAGTRDIKDAMSRASEVLTADEIANLEGGICGGLVVLSACQTGEGKVSSEGLLGLGRAVLQAGASSAALMLWKVDDDSTKDLVAGLLHHLVDEEKTIVVSTQLAMLQLLRSGSCIYNWAPLMALGSPTARLVVK